MEVFATDNSINGLGSGMGPALIRRAQEQLSRQQALLDIEVDAVEKLERLVNPDMQQELEDARKEVTLLRTELQQAKDENRMLAEELFNTRHDLLMQQQIEEELRLDLENAEQELEELRCEIDTFKIECRANLERAQLAENELRAKTEAEVTLRKDLEASWQVQPDRKPAYRIYQAIPFSPQVAVYDLEDETLGVQRVVVVHVPGRQLTADGKATVSGSVRALDNGVAICLTKAADIPQAAKFVAPYFMPDMVGSWEWKYEPADGTWKFEESLGFIHGVFALTLRKVKPARKSPIVGKRRRSAPPAPTDLNVIQCSAVLGPPWVSASSSQKQTACFEWKSTFLTEEAVEIKAGDVRPGTLLLGLHGVFEVLSVEWEERKRRDVAYISSSQHNLRVLANSRVVVTTCGSAVPDWHLREVCDLHADAFDVGIQSDVRSGKFDETAKITSLGLLQETEAMLILELPDASPLFLQWEPVLSTARGPRAKPWREGAVRSSSTPFKPTTNSNGIYKRGNLGTPRRFQERPTKGWR